MKKASATSPGLPRFYKLGLALWFLIFLLSTAGTFYYESQIARSSDSNDVKYLLWMVAAVMLMGPAGFLWELGKNPEDFCCKNWNETRGQMFSWCLFIPFSTFSMGTYLFDGGQVGGNIFILLPSFIVTVLVIGIILIERRYFLLKEKEEALSPAE